MVSVPQPLSKPPWFPDAATGTSASVPPVSAGQKVLATEPRRPDASRTSQEPWSVAESCLDACKRWEALLDGALPGPPGNFWGMCPAQLAPLGLAGCLPMGSPAYAGMLGFPYSAHLGVFPPWQRTPLPYSIGITGDEYLLQLPPAPTAAHYDAAARHLARHQCVGADELPWKLSCSELRPSPGASVVEPLATPPATQGNLVAGVSDGTTVSLAPPRANTRPVSSSPAGAAVGAFLLQLIKDKRDVAAITAHQGAEAGAVLLQHLKGGSKASGVETKGDSTAGAVLLNQLRQQKQQNVDKWWLSLDDIGEAPVADESDGIIEARLHTDGHPYVWVDGQWIEAPGKYYCWYCGVFGNNLEVHFSSEQHKKKQKGTCGGGEGWKHWDGWGRQRKRKGWH